MNDSVKNVIIFAVGAAVGSICTWFGVKKYYETISAEEIEEVRKVYEERLSEVEPHRDSIDGELSGPAVIDVKEKVKELNNKPDLIDYTKYFKEKGERLDGVKETLRDAKEAADKEGLSEDELAEMEHPQEDIPYTNEEDMDQSLDVIDYQLNGASKDAIANDKAPYEIEPSDFELTCGNYEKTSLTWYHFDQLLANEEEEIVDEHLLVGDVISSSGFDGNEADVLYVRNDKIMADFEITKVYEAYGKGK